MVLDSKVTVTLWPHPRLVANHARAMHMNVSCGHGSWLWSVAVDTVEGCSEDCCRPRACTQANTVTPQGKEEADYLESRNQAGRSPAARQTSMPSSDLSKLVKMLTPCRLTTSCRASWSSNRFCKVLAAAAAASGVLACIPDKASAGC